MEYTMEELLVPTAALARRYTSGESTSVTWERAQYLMEAVIYCIDACAGENDIASGRKPSAEEAYDMGYEKIKVKVRQAQKSYNQMMESFCAYGNENYEDTVGRALPGFFMRYDARFAPQETVITMDYPTFASTGYQGLCGIRAIEKYVEEISLEQQFLRGLPIEYCTAVLYAFDASYERQFYNICSVILRHLLGCMLAGRPVGDLPQPGAYEQLAQRIRSAGTQLETQLENCLRWLIREKYEGSEALYLYLKADLHDFSVSLKIAAKNGVLHRIVVL